MIPAAALIDRIYEAGAVPDQWRDVLQEIADANEAVGANLIKISQQNVSLLSSPQIEQVTKDFDASGFNGENTRLIRLMERPLESGFLADSHTHSKEEIATLPMYADFLTPRGVDAGAGTIIPGPSSDILVLAVEGFRSHRVSRKVVPRLNSLRPHLARAVTISSQVQSAKARTLLEAFDVTGMAVALLDPQGRPIGINPRFKAMADGLFKIKTGALSPIDSESDKTLSRALADLRDKNIGSSIAIRDAAKVGAAVLHLAPACTHRNMFSTVAIYAVLVRPGNLMLPSADIIAVLFDLTPAEAVVARSIALGTSPKQIALELNISHETVRTQLKHVFSKTSVKRQGELAALIAKFQSFGSSKMS